MEQTTTGYTGHLSPFIIVRTPIISAVGIWHPHGELPLSKMAQGCPIVQGSFTSYKAGCRTMFQGKRKCASDVFRAVWTLIV